MRLGPGRRDGFTFGELTIRRVTCAILCYPCVTFVVLRYFLRLRLKMLKFLLYIYHVRLALMGIHASLRARH